MEAACYFVQILEVTSKSSSCSAIYVSSRKPFKKDKMATAVEVKTNTLAIFSIRFLLRDTPVLAT